VATRETKNEDKKEAARIHPDTAWLSYREAMILSGWSRSTISRLVRSGQLQHARIGKRGVKVKRAALIEMMERGGNPTISDGR
jgi:excisionase family DNA binding protein